MASPFIYLPQRAVLSLSGPDTITLLERLVTHATNDWEVGTTRYGALLTPQGKVLSDYLAIRTETGVLLDTAAEFANDLAKRLKMFRLRSQVEIERLEDTVIAACIEPASEAVEAPDGADRVYLDHRYPDDRQRVLMSRENRIAARSVKLEDDAQALAAYHADRIAHSVPEQGLDFGTADVFPADINMDVLDGVALNKGCFVGQEVVSRMHRRGKIRKRTLPVKLASLGKVEAGDSLLAPAPIGEVTSVQDTQALARIRIDRWQKAEADQSAIVINETPVTIAKPDWLVAELNAKTD